MGTRHLTCVIKDGEFRVAQYGQWDGYPSGQGATILTFLAKADLNQFRDRVEQCHWLDLEDFEERYKTWGFPEDGFMDRGESEMFKGAFPYLGRDLGAEILEEIYHATDIVELRNESAFAHDSLMCEWAYVIDLDRNVFEVYRGFNQDPNASSGVFASVPNEVDQDHRDEKYATVVLLKTYSLDDLPTIDVLIEECDKDEDEEE